MDKQRGDLAPANGGRCVVGGCAWKICGMRSSVCMRKREDTGRKAETQMSLKPAQLPHPQTSLFSVHNTHTICTSQSHTLSTRSRSPVCQLLQHSKHNVPKAVSPHHMHQLQHQQQLLWLPLTATGAATPTAALVPTQPLKLCEQRHQLSLTTQTGINNTTGQHNVCGNV